MVDWQSRVLELGVAVRTCHGAFRVGRRGPSRHSAKRGMQVPVEPRTRSHQPARSDSSLGEARPVPLEQPADRTDGKKKNRGVSTLCGPYQVRGSVPSLLVHPRLERLALLLLGLECTLQVAL